MITTIVFLLLSFLGVTLQTTLLHSIAFAGVMPNLVLAFTVASGILLGRWKGAAVGAFAGLMEDLLLSRVLGFSTAIFFLIGYVFGSFYKDFNKSNLVLPLYCIAAAELVYGLLMYLIFRFFSGDLNLGYYFVSIILPEICYTCLVGAILYPLWKLIAKGCGKADRFISSRKAAL